MDKLIFDREPQKWQDLEKLVHQAFDEMGYVSEIGKEVPTVRGKVRIDVFAKKTTSAIPAVVLCECKYWKKRVDQNVIHAFRSVCADAGAHLGLIISKVGFQSGAGESREKTNIHLLNFREFQSTYFREWADGIFIRFIHMRDALLLLIPGNPNVKEGSELLAKLSAIEAFKKYDIFFGPNNYVQFFLFDRCFPITITDPRGDPNVLKAVTINSPRQYYEIACQAVSDARAYFGL